MFLINLILQSWSYHANNANHDSALMTVIASVWIASSSLCSSLSSAQGIGLLGNGVHSSSSSSIKGN